MKTAEKELLSIQPRTGFGNLEKPVAFRSPPVARCLEGRGGAAEVRGRGRRLRLGRLRVRRLVLGAAEVPQRGGRGLRGGLNRTALFFAKAGDFHGFCRKRVRGLDPLLAPDAFDCEKTH